MCVPDHVEWASRVGWFASIAWRMFVLAPRLWILTYFSNEQVDLELMEQVRTHISCHTIPRNEGGIPARMAAASCCGSAWAKEAKSAITKPQKSGYQHELNSVMKMESVEHTPVYLL
jgi:hypothetical protein